MATWLQELQFGVNIFNNVSPMGVLTIVVIAFVVLPRLKFLQRFLKGMGLCAGNPYAELQPILLQMAKTIELIKGNDLTHLKQDIMSLGEKMDSIDSRFINHDNQAKAILTRTNDVWDVVKNLKK
jgi:hypothetical protein